MHALNHLSSIHMFIFGENDGVCFFNHGLEYQLMDQRTHAILIMCAYKFQCEFVLLIPRNANCNLCALFKHGSGWKNESSCGRIGRYIFCQCGFKSHHIKKIH